MDTTIDLIAETYTENEIGEDVSIQTSRTVFARISSVTRAEWFNAGRLDMQPAFVVILSSIDYEGEKIAAVDGRQYLIYRTYRLEETDEIELYLQERAGVKNG